MKLSSDLQNKLNLLLQSQYWPLSKLQELQIDKLNNNLKFNNNIYHCNDV